MPVSRIIISRIIIGFFPFTMCIIFMLNRNNVANRLETIKLIVVDIKNTFQLP